ncbi:MAG: UDP-3-O-acyl-N-acetylglucosamine deacetylase [Roseinatronobacter sp.]
MQNTLAKDATISGTGLHSGKPVRVRLRPAPVDTGLLFRRVDAAPGTQDIRVTPENWVEASLCTILANAHGVRVVTIEHLLAALHGCGIHNVIVELDSEEVPILDGSAAPFVRKILATGVQGQGAPLRVLRVLQPVTVTKDAARATLLPAPALELAFEIDFADPAIGYQSRAFRMANGAFLRELSDCRTFCLRRDVEAMQAAGLALGGTLDNAVVFHEGEVLSPGGLRRADEPVRHKMLDVMGDLYVAGMPLLARYEGVRAGHALTGRVLQALFARPEAYEIVTISPLALRSLPGAGISMADLPLSA